MIPAFLANQENKKRRGEHEQENRVGAETGDKYQYDTENFIDGDDEPVLESKGSSPPPVPSPMEEAQAQIELERQRAAMEQAAAERTRQREEAARMARIDKARGLQAQAYGSAQDYANTQIGARGFDSGLIDQYGLLDLYNQALDTTRMGIAEDNLNPMASYNTNTMFNDALETARGTYRGDLSRQLEALAPDNYGYTMFGDASDDSILQTILGQRRSDAQTQIDAARDRGQLNEVGYQRALDQLGIQSEAAMSDLQDLGLGVLSGYRDQLGSMREGMVNDINNAGFNDPLSFDVFGDRLNQTTSDLTNRMSGDIYRATQGQSFFDPSSIITQSGALQGFYNPSTSVTQKAPGVSNPLVDAFTEEEGKRKTQNDTGVNGVF